MRVYTDYRFVVKALSGNGELITYPGCNKTLYDVRKTIDYENQRAVQNGWKASQWYICREDYYKEFDDDDHFVCEKSSIRRIELYPPTLP